MNRRFYTPIPIQYPMRKFACGKHTHADRKSQSQLACCVEVVLKSQILHKRPIKVVYLAMLLFTFATHILSMNAIYSLYPIGKTLNEKAKSKQSQKQVLKRK